MLYGELLANAGDVLGSRDNFNDFVKYVSYMQQHGKVNISTLPIDNIAGIEIENGKLFIREINKNSINKAIFESCEKPTIEPIDPQILTSIAKSSSRGLADQLNRLERDAQRNLLDAQRRQSDVMSFLGAYGEFKRRIAQLKNHSQDMWSSQVNTIHLGGFWKFHEYDPVKDELEFVTRNEVIIEHNERNDDHDVNISRKVNLGYFKLKFCLKDHFEFMVLNHKNNIFVHEYSHPHISDGVLCLGNASSAVTQAIGQLDIVSISRVVNLILTTYNPESPYVSLSAFETEYNKRLKLLTAMRDEEKLLKHYIDVLSNDEELDFFE